ncbi:unnamed protein product [Trichogramma brassicae]|uniref:Uncharacterized protein n=1 Tax=Trichogramma brassicae TaxID=86971 RepID=A0A6H5IYM4_9HYME|nr:unnamed protein product [Trichogramma brassicae]
MTKRIGHTFDWDATEILDNEPNHKRRLISEMLYICDASYALNKKEDTQKLNFMNNQSCVNQCLYVIHFLYLTPQRDNAYKIESPRHRIIIPESLQSDNWELHVREDIMTQYHELSEDDEVYGLIEIEITEDIPFKNHPLKDLLDMYEANENMSPRVNVSVPEIFLAVKKVSLI